VRVPTVKPSPPRTPSQRAVLPGDRHNGSPWAEADPLDSRLAIAKLSMNPGGGKPDDDAPNETERQRSQRKEPHGIALSSLRLLASEVVHAVYDQAFTARLIHRGVQRSAQQSS
jgi:hypothetical protein